MGNVTTDEQTSLGSKVVPPYGSLERERALTNPAGCWVHMTDADLGRHSTVEPRNHGRLCEHLGHITVAALLFLSPPHTHLRRSSGKLLPHSSLLLCISRNCLQGSLPLRHRNGLQRDDNHLAGERALGSTEAPGYEVR